jgi:hypothetical protein
MTGKRAGESQNMHAPAKRKRSWAAAVTGKTDDALACLRGAVNEVQKKKRILDITDDRDACFFGRLIAWPRWHACSAKGLQKKKQGELRSVLSKAYEGVVFS